MKILGKYEIDGVVKNVLVKEEGENLEYYYLELIKEENNILYKSIHTIKSLGEFVIEGEKREVIVIVDEEKIKYYYIIFIGSFPLKLSKKSVILKEDTLENKVSAEIKGSQQKNKMIEMEKNQLKRILEEHNNRKNREQQEKIQKNKKKEFRNNIRYLTKDKIKNKIGDIEIKQSIDINTRVTDFKNLEQVIEKAGKMPKLKDGDKPVKMGIVESDDLENLKNEKGEKEHGHFSRYEAVIITKDDEIKVLDLENDMQEGNNPLEKNYQVMQNGEIENDDVITRMKIGEGTISVDKGQYGEVQVFHSPRKTLGGKDIEGNKSLDRQLETSNSKNVLKGTNKDTLNLSKEYGNGYRSVEDGYQEMKTHEQQQEKLEEVDVRDIDGDLNTKSHEHSTEEYIELKDGTKVTYEALATRWGFFKNGKPDGEFIKKEYDEILKKGQKDNEEIIKQLDEEYEDPRAPQER